MMQHQLVTPLFVTAIITTNSFNFLFLYIDVYDLPRDPISFPYNVGVVVVHFEGH